MDNTNYNEKYIKGLIVKVVKSNACKLIYDVNKEKYVACFKFNENYYDLSDDIKYNIKCYLEKNYSLFLEK
uniref:Uncharacterized protein n=1 Tax=viral metagenome TaxID=1070528 RepID=A0A6C0D711_9ZZZZ